MKPWHVQFSVLPGAVKQISASGDVALLMDDGLQRGPLMTVDLVTGAAGWGQLGIDGRLVETYDKIKIMLLGN